MDIAIIGAGIAGLAAAERLVADGHRVRLFDKGRGAGGRMATRRIAEPAAAFDHGAQYFTVRDGEFAARVAQWREAGLAAPWPAAGTDAWVGTPAMNAPLRAMAAALAVQWQARVDTMVRDGDGWRLSGDGIDPGRHDAVVLAIPAEQAAVLLAPAAPDLAGLAGAARSLPCWTAMATFAAPVAAEDILPAAGPIGWAARNSAKPGRTGAEAWVIQATPEWSAANLEVEAETAAIALLAALADRITAPLPELLSLTGHRWRYAQPATEGPGPVWDTALQLGLCGDWLHRGRVEAAWLSGHRLAAAIARSGESNAATDPPPSRR